jgi:hypothetical protein
VLGVAGFDARAARGHTVACSPFGEPSLSTSLSSGLDLSRPNPLPAVMRSSRRTPKHPELLIVR